MYASVIRIVFWFALNMWKHKCGTWPASVLPYAIRLWYVLKHKQYRTSFNTVACSLFIRSFTNAQAPGIDPSWSFVSSLLWSIVSLIDTYSYQRRKLNPYNIIKNKKHGFWRKISLFLIILREIIFLGKNW